MLRALLIAAISLILGGCLTPSPPSDARDPVHVMLDQSLEDWIARSPNLTRAEPRLQPDEVLTMIQTGVPRNYQPPELSHRVVLVPHIIRHSAVERAKIRVDREHYPVSYHVLYLVKLDKGFRTTRITIGDNLHRPGAAAQATYTFKKKNKVWTLETKGPITLK